jgi:hypothetical protein
MQLLAIRGGQRIARSTTFDLPVFSKEFGSFEPLVLFATVRGRSDLPCFRATADEEERHSQTLNFEL